jgi:hypothetical protein
MLLTIFYCDGIFGCYTVPSVGRLHWRLLCQRPQPALGKGHSTGVNPGQLLCQELMRRPSAQVASVPTASRRSHRHSGRQPKCDGARSFSDGALRAEGWLSAKRWFCRGSRPADGPAVGKGCIAVSTSVPSATLGKEILCREPDKKPSAKPETLGTTVAYGTNWCVSICAILLCTKYLW